MFFYIDESGHPHPKDSHDRPVVVAVCISPSEIRHVTGALYSFTQKLDRDTPGTRLRADEREGKATSFLTRRDLMEWPAKRAFANSVVQLMRDLEMAVFAMVMESPDEPLYRGTDHLQSHHRWLLERVNRWMERFFPDRYATPVFDGRDPTENKRLDECYAGYLFRHPTGRGMERIVPNVLFVDSELTPGIKLADFCAYILRVYYEEGLDEHVPDDDDYLQIMARYGEVLRAKTWNYRDEEGRMQWGIRTMSKEHFRYVGEEDEAEPGDDER